MEEKKKPELLTIHSPEAAEQPFEYSVGVYGSRFLRELNQNEKFVGVRCPECKRVYIPPREVCSRCFCRMSEPVEVGPQGEIISYTILRFPFVDPETGDWKPVPFGYAFIKLDGASTCFQHYFTVSDESRIKVGARLEPVFKDKSERKGTVLDILHFQLVE